MSEKYVPPSRRARPRPLPLSTDETRVTPPGTSSAPSTSQRNHLSSSSALNYVKDSLVRHTEALVLEWQVKRSREGGCMCVCVCFVFSLRVVTFWKCAQLLPCTPSIQIMNKLPSHSPSPSHLPPATTQVLSKRKTATLTRSDTLRKLVRDVARDLQKQRRGTFDQSWDVCSSLGPVVLQVMQAARSAPVNTSNISSFSSGSAAGARSGSAGARSDDVRNCYGDDDDADDFSTVRRGRGSKAQAHKAGPSPQKDKVICCCVVCVYVDV